MNLVLADWLRTTRFTHPMPSERVFRDIDECEDSSSDSGITEDTADENNDYIDEEANEEGNQKWVIS